MTSHTVSSPAAANTVGARFADALLLVACIGVAGGLSILMGQDSNWDLQNYHFYIGWAWWHDHRAYTTDIAAAQLQTYHNPLLDLPFFLMVDAGWDPRAIAFALAVPAGIAGYFAIKLAPLLYVDLPRAERWLAVACAVAIGLTAAMGRGALGTTMNEWPGAALTMAALYVVVRALVRAPGAAIPTATLVGAGLLVGLANGFKFTYGVYAVGLAAAILWRGPIVRGYILRAWREAFVFGIAVLVGTAAAAGPWMYALWSQFRNPIFPYGNIWIKSPWWGQYEAMGRAFGPHTFVDWLTFPFTLTAPKAFYVTEVDYIDARLTLLYGLVLLAGAAAIVQRISGRRDEPSPTGNAEVWRVIGLFFVVAFLIWTAQHSILRYLIPLFILSGALIVVLLRHVLRPGFAPTAIVIVTIALVASTKINDWGRIEFGSKWFDVDMTQPDPNALVLLTSQEPMSYVAPFFPPDAKFLGINNSISDAKRKTLMEDEIRRLIREHRGPIYSLAYPKGAGIDALLERGLLQITETCVPITTNQRTSPIEMCRVVRASDSRPPG
ncbi:MAG: hypothetical protein U1F15_04180 [Burkholderiales bacterium]